jgi:ABC-type bacteriocin/lantibiotic exporter with double-glycine peptidase domain
MTRRSPQRLAASITLLLLAACATSRPDQLSPSATVLPTPLVAQDELHECGLAAISSLCSFYSVAIPEAERQALAQQAREQEGLSGKELRAALEGLGFEVWIFEGRLDHEPTGALRHVEQGRPLLVMTSEDGRNHYSLLIGHDPELGNVVLLDPRRGRVLLPEPAFEQQWSTVRRFTLLAVPAARTGDVAQAEPNQETGR